MPPMTDCQPMTPFSDDARRLSYDANTRQDADRAGVTPLINHVLTPTMIADAYAY